MPTTTLRHSAFHVAGSGASSAPLCDTPSAYRRLLCTLAQSCPPRVPVLSYALLPRQWHIVVGPCDPAVVVRWLDGAGLTRRERLAALRGDAHEELIYLCRHVERLALDLRLVHRAQDWPWCSLADRLRPQALLPIVPAPFLGTRAWVDYVNRRSGELSGDRSDLPRRLA